MRRVVYGQIYTDGRCVVGSSARQLHSFMEECGLDHLPCNSASFVAYYLIEREHLPRVIDQGAELLTTYQLNNLIRTTGFPDS